MKRTRNPFTLVELLVAGVIITVVITIIVVVAGVLIGGCIIIKKANEEDRKPSIEHVSEGPEKSEEPAEEK